MRAPGVLLVLFLCICVSHANSFAFPRYSNRRPRTRLFGTSSSLASPARYNSEPRRASVVPFRIPGFERSQASITSSRASRLGFDLGLGGRALSDPIASMYDSAGGGGGSRLSFINGVGDLGGFDTLGGGGDLYAGSLGFNDGFITAASSRDLKMLDLNSAGNRLRQPIDIGNYGNQMMPSSGLGGRGILNNQDQLRNFDLNFDSSGLGGGGGGGSGGQFMVSGGGSHQRGGLASQTDQRLGGGSGSGQLALGSNTWIGLDSNDFNSGGIGLASNQVNGLGGSGSANMGIGSGIDQFSLSSFSSSSGSGQMGLSSNQLGSSLPGSQLETNPLGLSQLGTNQVGVGVGQVSSLDVAGNQLGGITAGQQGFLGQGQSGGLLGSVGSTGNTLSSQLSQGQLDMTGMSGGGQLSSLTLQSNVGGHATAGVGSGLGNQISSNSFNSNLGVLASSLTGGSLSSALPTQETLTSGQFVSNQDPQAITITGQQNDVSSLSSGALSGAPGQGPLPTGLAPSTGEVSPTSGLEQLSPRQATVPQYNNDGGLEQFVSGSSGIIGQFSVEGPSAGQFVSRDSSQGQFVSRDSGQGQFVSRDSGQGQFLSRDSDQGQFVSRDSSQGQFISRDSGHGQFVSRDSSRGQFASEINGGGSQITSRQGDFGQFVTNEGKLGQLSVESNGLGQFASLDQNLGQFSGGENSLGQYPTGSERQISQGGETVGQLLPSGPQGAGQSLQVGEGVRQYFSNREGAGQIIFDSGQTGATDQLSGSAAGTGTGMGGSVSLLK